MARFWRGPTSGVDDLADVQAPPQARLAVAAADVPRALAHLGDPTTYVEDEVRGVAAVDGDGVVTFGHRYDRRTAMSRRLHAVHRIGVEVSDFAWLDPETDPNDAWLADAFDRWETGRHRDPDRLEPIEVARGRFGRLVGQAVLDRLLGHVAERDLDQRRRWTVAHAAVLTAFNTHTTEAGDAMVACGTKLAATDGYAAMVLLDGARGVADLDRFGIRTAIAEAPLVPLLEHRDWQLHGSATGLLAALTPPRSDAATDVLVRLGLQLADGAKSTEIRSEQVVGALATTAPGRTDVDDALDALRSHASPTVRGAAATVRADRRPDRARALWEPWLTSRSTPERLAAESLIATWGDRRDVAEVVRIVEHRTRSPKGIRYSPPLSSGGIDFLTRHADVPEAVTALGRVRQRWGRHDDGLRRWLREHHPELIPPDADEA